MDERVSGRQREEEKQTNDAQKIREYGNKSINGKCGTTSIKGVVFPESREFRLGCSAAQEDDVRGRKGEPKWRPDSLDHYFMWCIYNEGRGGGGERLKPIPFRLFWSRRLDCIWMERLPAKIYIMKAEPGRAGGSHPLSVCLLISGSCQRQTRGHRWGWCCSQSLPSCLCLSAVWLTGVLLLRMTAR